jgi:hypothetical protein
MADELPFIRRRTVKRVRVRESFHQISISESRRLGWSIWWAMLMLAGTTFWYLGIASLDDNDWAELLIAIFIAVPLAFWALVSLPLNNRVLLNGRDKTIISIRRYFAIPIKVDCFAMRSGYMVKGEAQVLEQTKKEGCILWCVYRLLGPIGLAIRLIRYAIKTNTAVRSVPALLWLDQASSTSTPLLAFENVEELDRAIASMRAKFPDAFEPTRLKRF